MKKEVNYITLAGTHLAGHRLQIAPGERTKPAPIPAQRFDGAIDNAIDGRFTGQERLRSCSDERRSGHGMLDMTQGRRRLQRV